MATHVSLPTRRRRRSPVLVTVSLLLGIIYGAYTSFLARGGGAATYGQLALALISGVGLAVLIFALGTFQRALPRELRAAAYGVLVGGSVGFLHSLSGATLLRSCGTGFAVGAATVAVMFYAFYVHET